MRALLQEHGVVCICRSGQDTRQLLFEHDILFNNRVSLPVYLCSCHVFVLANKVIKLHVLEADCTLIYYLELSWVLFFPWSVKSSLLLEIILHKDFHASKFVLCMMYCLGCRGKL